MIKDKIKTCNYCSNSRTYTLTDEEELDSNFCFDDDTDYSSQVFFVSEDKNHRIMHTIGDGKPPRLEFEFWNNNFKRWDTYDIKFLKFCFNCGRKIIEYPEFKTYEEKKIAKLKINKR